LVAPAALGKRFRQGMLGRLVFAWIFGFIGLFLAFLLSYYLDLPSGPAIVCTLTAGFFLSLLWRVPPRSQLRA
jgi:ABC-type Mn2+/Zn2+ transport system permease subunit